ncbi:hypothetical protein D3C76_1279330 [compost metagenome]
MPEYVQQAFLVVAVLLAVQTRRIQQESELIEEVPDVMDRRWHIQFHRRAAFAVDDLHPHFAFGIQCVVHVVSPLQVDELLLPVDDKRVRIVDFLVPQVADVEPVEELLQRSDFVQPHTLAGQQDPVFRGNAGWHGRLVDDVGLPLIRRVDELIVERILQIELDVLVLQREDVDELSPDRVRISPHLEPLRQFFCDLCCDLREPGLHNIPSI